VNYAFFRNCRLLVAMWAICIGLPLPASAQELEVPILLPGGASSLTETHGDWTVRCQVVTQSETAERICTMGQRQTNAQGQQVLAIELLLSPDGMEGSVILPFGLAVSQAVSLTIDEGEPIQSVFSTCLPAGCVVPIAVSSETLSAMRGGSTLVIAAQNLDGQTLELRVSLAGFTAATQRILALVE
jgi:invasion protein IalB